MAWNATVLYRYHPACLGMETFADAEDFDA